jgi:hypothetical protein
MRLIDWQLAFEQHLLSETSTANSHFAGTLLGGPTLDVDTGLAIYPQRLSVAAAGGVAP